MPRRVNTTMCLDVKTNLTSSQIGQTIFASQFCLYSNYSYLVNNQVNNFYKGIYFGQKPLFKPPTLLRFLICPPFFRDFLRFLLRKTHFIKENPYLPPVFFKNPYYYAFKVAEQAIFGHFQPNLTKISPLDNFERI